MTKLIEKSFLDVNLKKDWCLIKNKKYIKKLIKEANFNIKESNVLFDKKRKVYIIFDPNKFNDDLKSTKVIFLTKIQGGSREVIGSILTIGLLLAAPSIGAALGGYFGLAVGGIGQSILTAAVALGGTYLINNLIIPHSPVGTKTTSAKVDDLHGIQNQNSIRIGDTIPVPYGKIRMFPDIVSLPIKKENQYVLHYSLGIGELESVGDYKNGYSKFVLDAKNTADFLKREEDISKRKPLDIDEYTRPSEAQNITLEYQVGITRQNSLDGIFTNFFTLSDPIHKIDEISINVLFKNIDGGNIFKESIAFTFTVEYMEIDEADNEIAGTTKIKSFTKNLVIFLDVGRVTLFTLDNLKPARYKARFRFYAYTAHDEYIGVSAVIADITGRLIDKGRYEDINLLKIAMTQARAEANFTNVFSVEVKRKLRVYRNKQWFTEFSQSFIWCVFDLFTNKEYGLNVPEDNFDLDILEDTDKKLTALGYKCNLLITTSDVGINLCAKILSSARCVILLNQVTSLYEILLDEDKPIVKIFTDIDIVKDSLLTSMIGKKNATIKYVEIVYNDDRNNKKRTKVFNENEEINIDPKKPYIYLENDEFIKAELFGITDHTQIAREARYLLRSHKKRNKIIKFLTHQHAYALKLHDRIGVAYSRENKLTSGYIKNISGNTFELSSKINPNSKYIVFSNDKTAQKYSINIIGEKTITVDNPPVISSLIDTQYMAIQKLDFFYKCIIIKIEEKENFNVGIECVVDDVSIYT